jgi:antiviral helicase SKI2
MLSLVDPETKGGKLGMNSIFLDLWTTDSFPIKDIPVPPRWPPSPDSLSVTDGIYELRAVPLTSIAIVTSRTIKVWERETSFFWQRFTGHH